MKLPGGLAANAGETGAPAAVQAGYLHVIAGKRALRHHGVGGERAWTR